MRKRSLLWTLGIVVAIVAVVMASWMSRSPRPTATLPDGTRITFLKATYGRHHRYTEWRFQWALPPIQREVHQFNTPTDALRLWVRMESKQPLHLTSLDHSVAVTADGRFCLSYVNLPAWRKRPSGGFDAIMSFSYEGLPADGSRVELRFYAPNASPNQSPASLWVRLPQAPVLNQVKQPEPLPAARSGNLLKVRLNGFRWVYHRWKPAGAVPTNEEVIYACPDWQLTLPLGSLDEWEVANIHFAPLGAGPVFPMINRVFGASPQSIATEVEGSWRAPIYRFYVQFLHTPTGKRESFEFYVSPPPVEQLRQREQLEAQSRKALQRGDYARAVQVWENAPVEFALQAHYWRGSAYALKGDYARAAAEFQQAAGLLQSVSSQYDQEYEARPALALCLLLMGRRADAAQVARDFTAQVAQHRECLWETELLASALCLLMPEVAPPLQRVDERTRAWVQLARQRRNQAYAEMAQRARAIQAALQRDYRRASRLFPRSPRTYNSDYDPLLLALLYKQAGNLELARFYHDEARAFLRPRRGDQQYLNGMLLMRILFPSPAQSSGTLFPDGRAGTQGGLPRQFRPADDGALRHHPARGAAVR